MFDFFWVHPADVVNSTLLTFKNFNMVEINNLIPEQDLLKSLNITRATMWRHRKAGLKHYRIGRKVFYSIEDIKCYMPSND